MTAARADNAARDLLVRLIDEADLETAPPDEVRADLALLGIDAARSIRFSRRLAAEASAPASDLLGKSLASEDNDREISELENADLDAVRAELSAATPLAAAHAQRLANTAMSATGRRHPSRRLWYGIGGAITAIAASVLIVVSLSTPNLSPRQMAFAPDDETPDALRRLEKQPPASEALEIHPSTPPAPAASAVPPKMTDVTARSAKPITTRDLEGQLGGSAADATETAKTIELARNLDLSLLEAYPVDARNLRSVLRPASQGGVSDLIVTAALILQPELAPEPLRQSDLGDGRLKARLSEAALFPVQRDVVALVTVQRGDGTSFDGLLLQSRWAFDRESAGSGAASQEAGLAEQPLSVPAVPTIRDLLGDEANRYALFEMNPNATSGQDEAPQ